MAKNYKIHQETRKYDPGTIEEVINESRSRDSPDNGMSDWALKISRIKNAKGSSGRGSTTHFKGWVMTVEKQKLFF